jgi:exonuclease VII small subunit
MPHAPAARAPETELPPADTRRWVAARKAQVVEAIQSGRLSLDEAWRLYRLGVEEFGVWKRALIRAGVQGLRVAEAQAEALGKRRVRRSRSRRRPNHG